MYDNLLHKTNNSLDKMQEHIKMSDQLLEFIKNKVNSEFNKEVIRLGCDNLKIYEKNLNELKIEISNIKTKDEEIAVSNDRIHLLEENNKKIFDEVDNLLKKENLLKEKIVTDNEANDSIKNILSDKDIANLYDKYKKNKKNKTSKSSSKMKKVGTFFKIN